VLPLSGHCITCSIIQQIQYSFITIVPIRRKMVFTEEGHKEYIHFCSLREYGKNSDTV
jgi:hypothetical protein